MKSRINKILEEINNKKIELKKEYSKLKEKYWFKIEGKKIVFSSDIKQKNKIFKKSLADTIFSAEVREVLSIPFIYMMIIPAVILDLFLILYQNIAFRLYKIPLVKRKDYMIFDRKSLDYLNILQKFNCIYCSYVNWLFQYAVEVWWRTEKYWCPIKHAKKKKWEHDWERYFADYWDPEEFSKIFNKENKLKCLKKENIKNKQE